MKEIKNEDMIAEHGRYAKPLFFDKGFVVTRTVSPRSYSKIDGKESSAWLPSVEVYQPNEKYSLKLGGAFIVAKSPINIYHFFFQPSWDKTLKKDKNTCFTFKESFITEDMPLGDIVVEKRELRGYYDKNIEPGSIPYTSIFNRNITLHGSKKELEKMLTLASQNIPPHYYDLTFSSPCCATGDKKYVLKTNPEEVVKFARIAINEIFS